MKRVSILIATSVVISLGTVGAIYLYSPEPDRIDAAVRSIGFYPINPPTNLRGPGSIYHVSSDGLYLSMLCQVEHDKIQHALRSSPTTKQVSTELKKAKVGFGAQLLSQVISSADANVLQTVKLELDDVEVAEVSLEDLATIAGELMDRQSCGEQVQNYLKSGDYVCQGQQVLRATTTYSTQYNNTATANTTFTTQAAQAVDLDKTANIIKANVDADARVEGSKILSGKGLYYGMKLAPRCMFLPGDKPKRPPLTRWQRFLNWWV